MSHGYEYFLSVLACMEVGVPYVPMHISWPKSRVSYVKENSNVYTVIDESCFSRSALSEKSADLGKRQLSPEDPCYTIYTSGTTGAPKGAVIPRRAFSAYMEFLSEVFDVTPGERQLSVLEMSWDGALTDVAVFLLSQGKIAFSTAGKNIFQLGSDITKYKPTIMKIVPGSASMLLRETLTKRFSYTSLRQLILGGARIMPELYDRLHAYFGGAVSIYNHYGPTEFTVGSHVHKMTRDSGLDYHEQIGSIGKPSSATDCRLLDSDGEMIAERNQEGELLLGGDQLMLGYQGSPDATRDALITIDGMCFYRTGDLGFQNERGQWFVTGRTDETIKRKGYRINLRNIDAYIQGLASVADCATVSYQAEAGDQFVVTFVVPMDRNTGKDAIAAELRSVLPPTEMPDEIRMCAKLPTTDAGKIDRANLLASLQLK